MMPTVATSIQSIPLAVAWWHWLLLGGWFAVLIILDLFVINRKDKTPSLRTAVWQSVFWVGLGILLGVIIAVAFGREAGGQYFSGYLIEKSLSVDNVFAWSVILTYFKVQPKYQHRVLFWGILGAIVMRIIFIFAGVAVINRFEPILVLFGVILLISGIKLLATKEEDEFDPGSSRLYGFVKKFIPISEEDHGHDFFVHKNGKRLATALFMALVVIMFSDVIFAVDSVPAVLAVSHTPFIIIASNAAAILGMGALYFVFEFIKDKFWLLNHILGIILLFVGTKMIIAPHELFGLRWFGIEISTAVSLLVIFGLLTVAIAGSLLFPQKAPKKG